MTTHSELSFSKWSYQSLLDHLLFPQSLLNVKVCPSDSIGGGEHYVMDLGTYLEFPLVSPEVAPKYFNTW